MANSLPHEPSGIALSVIQALVLYSLVEHQLGHAKSIRVTANEHTFSVADDGRGHAVNRTVEGAPYLNFIYSQLDYPFEAGEEKSIQIQGIGMSLLNRLCSVLSVSVRKPEATLNMNFENGTLVHHEFLALGSSSIGTEISARIDTRFERQAVNPEVLRHWLLGVLAASPSLRLSFNGQVLVLPPSDA